MIYDFCRGAYRTAGGPKNTEQCDTALINGDLRCIAVRPVNLVGHILRGDDDMTLHVHYAVPREMCICIRTLKLSKI